MPTNFEFTGIELAVRLVDSILTHGDVSGDGREMLTHVANYLESCQITSAGIVTRRIGLSWLVRYE